MLPDHIRLLPLITHHKSVLVSRTPITRRFSVHEPFEVHLVWHVQKRAAMACVKENLSSMLATVVNPNATTYKKGGASRDAVNYVCLEFLRVCG
jgi:hypothetical protein